jgi:hypothetical protein
VFHPFEAGEDLEAGIVVRQPVRHIRELDRNTGYPKLVGVEITRLHREAEVNQPLGKGAASGGGLEHSAHAGPGSEEL